MLSEPRWVEVTRSEFKHERAGLAYVRNGLEDREPYRAWANFTFTDRDGKLYEVDLLVLTPTGVHLLELKDYAGTVAGDAGTWTITKPSGGRYSIDNPRILADRKAKKLKGLLLTQQAFKRVPAERGALYIDAAVFLSNPKVTVELDEAGRHGVFGRDPAPDQKRRPALPGIGAQLTSVRPGEQARVSHALVNLVTQALKQAGIRESTTHRRVGSYEIGGLIAEGELWQDFEGRHVEQGKARHRVRLYGPAEGMTTAETAELELAARREFERLHGVVHPGIERPIEYQSHARGPAQVFEHDPAARRLDLWLAEHAEDPDLDLLARADLLREIGEVVRYAHEQGLAHRALTPESIFVAEHAGGRQVRVRDWQSATRTTSTMSTRFGTVLGDAADLFTPERAQLYLAPEFGKTAEPLDAVTLDVFSLGAIGVLVLTGCPPAPDLAAREALLHRQGGLSLAAVADGVDGGLDAAIQHASAAVPADRPVSVGEFLEFLEEALEELTRPDEVDPLDAAAGAELPGGWRVTHRLGSGSTAVVLAVQGEGDTRVLKVARNDRCAERVREEHAVLSQVRTDRIVKAYELGEIAGRTVLHLEAAEETLAARLQRHGPLGLELLERFGCDLLQALVALEREGLSHRDIKPENLGVISRYKNDELHLVLFDFSLARSDPADLRAGTVGYLDPFLSERRTRSWDLDAERYAAAVTLHEMATGLKPQWGDGAVDPVHTDLTAPTIMTGQIDEHVRGPLQAFLKRALQRDPAARFDTATEMQQAWQRVFADLTEGSGAIEPAASDLDLTGVTLDTSLRELGLGPRQLNALTQLAITTCEELATHPRLALHQLPVGPATRRGLAHLADRLTEELATATPPHPDAADGYASIDRLTDLIVGVRQVPEQQRAVLRAFLGLDSDAVAWPSLRHPVEQLDLDHGEVTAALEAARARWSKRAEIGAVRRELIELLAERHGVAGADELAVELLRRRGSLADAPLRSQRARAVVRAALETEASLKRPRMRSQRVAERLLAALDGEVLLGEDTARFAAGTLIDTADALGPVADTLADAQPLRSPTEVLAELRAAELPRDAPRLPDGRLVRLAAAASDTAAVSSRLELYPAGMPPDRAVEEARSALIDRHGLTAEDIRRRVATRFPEAAPLPDRPELDALLSQSETGLAWQDRDDGQPGRYVLSRPDGVLATHLSATSTELTFTSPDARAQAVQVLDARLSGIATSGGFLALTVDARRLHAAARRVAEITHGQVLDLDAVLVAAMRRHADAAGANWTKLVEADAAPHDSRPRTMLLRLVTEAAPDVEAQLTQTDGVAVGVSVGLLARYDRLDLLERLAHQLAWRGSDTPLRGLVLLVPGTDPHARPIIDGRAIPVMNANQWAHIPSTWLTEHKEPV